MQWEHHLPEGCVLSVLYCLVPLRCRSQCFVAVTLHLTVCFLCSSFQRVLQQLLLRNRAGRFLYYLPEKEKKKFFQTRCINTSIFMLCFSVSLSNSIKHHCCSWFPQPGLILPCSWLPPGGVLCGASFIGGVDTSCQMLPASSITLTSCTVPFLLTSLVSVEFSQRYTFGVRCARLQYHHAVMENVLKPLL